MASVDATSADEVRRRRAKIGRLREELEKLNTRMEVVAEIRERTRLELEEALREEDAREVAAREEPDPTLADEELEEVQAKRTAKPPGLAEHEVRDAARRLTAFTMPELAAVLLAPVSKVKALSAGLQERGIIKCPGQRYRGQLIYEYVVPVEAGAAFETQQQARESGLDIEQDPSRGGLVSGGIAGTGSSLLSRLDKVVRVQARRAVQDGWALIERGDGHFALVKGDDTIHLSKTPRSADGEAKRIIERLRKSSNGSRGAVPYTGKPKGASGKPGENRKALQAGRKVKKRPETGRR